MSPRILKYATCLSCLVALTLLVFNVYYFFIRREVGISFYIDDVFFPSKDKVLMSPEYRDQVDQYEYFNQKLKVPADVVFIGDSLTKRFDVQEYFPGHFVLNRGIYSDTTVGLLKRLDRNINNLKINKLFLLIGYNDLQYRGIAEVVANITLILERIRAKKIYLQSLLPVDAKRGDINLRIKEMNDNLQKLCSDKGIEYVDLYGQLKDEKGGLSEKYLIDGIHLNGAGYRLWKELVEGKL
jgi:lysophospholipase L1-like esterase